MLTAADLRKMTPEERDRAFDAIYAANRARADRLLAAGNRAALARDPEPARYRLPCDCACAYQGRSA